MKSMMVAVMAVIVGLSTGCAQIKYLQDPANYRVNPLSGQRMYCHGDQRDNYTICEGFKTQAQIAQMDQLAKQYNPDSKFPGLSADPQNNQGGGEVRSGHFCYGDRRDDALWQCAGYQTPAQIAQKAEQAKIAEENARLAAKNQAIEDAKQAALDKIAAEKAARRQAIEEREQAIADAKAKAFAASPAGKLKAKREAEAQAKRDAEAINAIFGKNGIFGAAIENYNNMTPEERYQMERETAARRTAEFQQRSREGAARQRAQQDRNVFCHRNFGRSC